MMLSVKPSTVTCDTAYYTGTFTPDSTKPINSNTSEDTFQGVEHYSATTAKTICKITFYPLHSEGDITGLTYHVEVNEIDGSYHHTGQVGSDSDSFAGVNEWAGATAVTFTFPAPIVLAATKRYAIQMTTDDAASGVNYASLQYDNNIVAEPDDCDGGTFKYSQIANQSNGTYYGRDRDDCYDVIAYE